MRLLLSICLLLASVVAARAQALTWHTPGSPMHDEALLDSQAGAEGEAGTERVKTSGAGLRLSAALAWTISGDDGGAPLIWLSGAKAPLEQRARPASDGPVDALSRADTRPCDDRRAIRAYKRTLLPPDIV